MKTASADEVLWRIRNRETLRSLHVPEKLTLREIDDHGTIHRWPIRFVDCQLAAVDISFATFEEPVRFEGCRIESLFGMASFFPAGLAVERCVIAGSTDLSCGGHNRDGRAVVLADTLFGGFVTFFDAWWEGPVFVQRCNFASGTNLLNQSEICTVRFDVAPVIDGNLGRLDATTPRYV